VLLYLVFTYSLGCVATFGVMTFSAELLPFRLEDSRGVVSVCGGFFLVCLDSAPHFGDMNTMVIHVACSRLGRSYGCTDSLIRGIPRLVVTR
jgi:hypothetical protein